MSAEKTVNFVSMVSNVHLVVVEQTKKAPLKYAAIAKMSLRINFTTLIMIMSVIIDLKKKALNVFLDSL